MIPVAGTAGRRLLERRRPWGDRWVAIKQVSAAVDERFLLLHCHATRIFPVEVTQAGALGIPAAGREARPVIIRMMMHQAVRQVGVSDRTKVGQPDADVAVGGADQALVKSARLQQLLRPDKQVGALNVGIPHQEFIHIQLRWAAQMAGLAARFMVDDAGGDHVQIALGEQTCAAFQVVRLPSVIVIQHRDPCRRRFSLQPDKSGVDGSGQTGGASIFQVDHPRPRASEVLGDALIDRTTGGARIVNDD